MSNAIDQEISLRVLVVDDDEGIARIVAGFAQSMGCKVRCVADSRLVGHMNTSFDADVIFLDLCMPGADGVQVLQELSRSNCRSNIVLMSGLNERVLTSATASAEKAGLHVVGQIGKPFKIAEIRSILKPLIDRQNAVVTPAPVQSLQAIPEHPGPQLYYEEILSPSDVAGSKSSHYRIYPIWRTDTGATLSLQDALDANNRSQMLVGIMVFCLAKIGIDFQDTLKEDPDSIHFNFPICSLCLKDPQFLEMLQETVVSCGLSPEQFTLEFDLKEFKSAQESILDILIRLRIHGFRVAITGGKEIEDLLTSLRNLPIDEIILDVSGIEVLSKDEPSSESEYWLGSLVSYAKREHLDVSAKNVFTDAHQELAQRCNLAHVSGRAGQRNQASVRANDAGVANIAWH